MPRLNWFWLGFFLCQTIAVFSADIIQEVRVQGNRRVADESILYRVSIKAGDTLDPVRVTQDLKVLWGTGLFENLGAAVLDGTEGKIIIFSVQELPLITEVDYRGHKKVTKSTITDKIEEEKLTIPEESPLDYKRLKAVRNLIQGILEEKGMRYGTVEYLIEPLEAGTARVVFNINEGSKVRIHEIDFVGNTVFSDKKLRKTFKKTREHWMFSWMTGHDIFKEDLYPEDVDKVREKYWKKGYKDILLGEPELEVTDHTTEKMKRKTRSGRAENARSRKINGSS